MTAAHRRLTVGSLFAGIGGFDLGLERAGMEVVWQVEIDPFCNEILERHWPGVARFGDIRECDAGTLARVDVICGGFPCQDLSFANRQASGGRGLDGERSGLWHEYRRLVAALRPSYVVVENVPALLGRGLGSVLGSLAALGYDATWQVFGACDAGAPHIRERLWLVAYTPGLGRQALSLHPDPDQDPLGSPAGEGQWRQQSRRTMRGGFRRVPHGDALRVVDGVPDRLDRYRALGNAVVPQIAEYLGRRIVAHHRAAQP